MRVTRCILLLCFAPLAAFSASGTITFERLEINCPGSICNDGEPGSQTGDVSYTFTPGGNNVIDVLSTSNFQQRFFKYKAVVSHEVSAQPDELIKIHCAGDTNIEGGGRIFLTTASVPAGQRNRQNFALPEERVSVNLPRRNNPLLEVVYTFRCDLLALVTQGTVTKFTSFKFSEFEVRQNTIVRQSIEILEVTPPGQISGQPLLDPPPAPLTPGTRQHFNVKVKWEENSIPLGASLRMTFLADGERAVGTGGASLNRLKDGELVQANEQELATFNPILIPTDSSTLTLRIEIIETSFSKGVRSDKVWVTAPDVLYTIGDPSAITLIKPQPNPRQALLVGSKQTFSADVQIDLPEPLPGGRLQLTLLDTETGDVLARGPLTPLVGQTGTQTLTVPDVTLLEEGEFALQADLFDEDLTFLGATNRIIYKVELGDPLTLSNPDPDPEKLLAAGSDVKYSADLVYNLPEPAPGVMLLFLVLRPGIEFSTGLRPGVDLFGGQEIKGIEGTSGTLRLELPDRKVPDHVEALALRAVLLDASGEFVAQSNEFVYKVADRVGHIEVTQVIQDHDNGVELVAGKRTVVRVFVQGPDDTARVPVELTLSRGGNSESLTGQSLPFNETSEIEDDLFAARVSNRNPAAVFVLDREWTRRPEPKSSCRARGTSNWGRPSRVGDIQTAQPAQHWSY